MIFKIKILYILILFYQFISPKEILSKEENDKNTITLKNYNVTHELNTNSPINFKIENFIKPNNTFLYINIISKNGINNIKEKPYLIIHKIDEDDEGLISGNAIALPFNFDNFYLEIYNLDFSYQQSLYFSFIDLNKKESITLYEGEKFIFLADNNDYNFNIQYLKNNIIKEKTAFISKGFYEIKMKVDNKYSNKIDNAYYLVKEVEKNITNIEINIRKNEYLYFIGQSLDKNISIYLNDSKQFYYLENNKNVCLDINYLEEYNENQYELMFSKRNNINIYINNEIYEKETLIYQGPSNICLSLNNKDRAIVNFQLIKDENSFDYSKYQSYYYNYYNLQEKNSIDKIEYLKPNTIKNYSFILNNNSYIVDLIVLTGDAYIVENNQNKNTVKNIGNNQRLEISPKKGNKNFIENSLSFQIKANNEGAVYKVLIKENNIDNIWPMSICGIEAFKSETIDKSINFIPFQNYSFGEKIGIFINLINCNYDINYFINGFVNEKTFLISDYLMIEDINENDDCLMYVGALYLDLDEYMTLPEGNSLKFKLNSNIKIIRTNFYYAYSASVDPELYLRITIYKKDTLLNLTIIIEDIDYKETYELFETKNILIFDSSKAKELKLKEDKLYEIKFIFERNEKYKIDNNAQIYNKEIVFDINIKTSNKYPTLIKSKEVFSDIIINNEKNNINYYYSHIPWNSYGYIKLNFNWGKGNMFGKLVNINNSNRNGGWKNKIILPDEKDEKNSESLEFDISEQKISFNNNHTSKCGKYCYIIIGVKTYDNYMSDINNNKNKLNYELFSEYKIIIRFFEKINNINYIDIHNNQFIFNSLLYQDKYEHYKYNFINNDINELFVEFKSNNCYLDILYNNNELIKSYKSHGENKFEEIKIDKKKNKNILIIVKELEEVNDINKVNMNFKLRIFEKDNLFKNITTIDSDLPVYCKPTIKENNLYFCNYLLTLDNIYTENIIVEIIAQELEQINNKPELYLDVIEYGDVVQKIKENKEIEFPDKNTNEYKNKTQLYNNYIILTKENLIEYSNITVDKNINDLFLLISVSTPVNATIELHSYIHNTKKNDNLTIFPFNNEYQYFSCYMNNTLKIKIPDDDNYYLQIISIEDIGNITIGDESPKNEKGLILNNIKNKNIEIKSYKYEMKENSFYRFYIFYKKNLQDSIINKQYYEKIRTNDGFKFINEKNLPIEYIMDVSKTNITNDINIYIYITYLKSANTTVESSNENYIDNFTEYLIIKAKLESYNSDQIEEYKEEYFGKYDVVYHGGRIIIPKENITKFKENFQSTYIKIKIESVEENKRIYKSIQGNILLIIDNDIKEKIPKSTFITNVFKSSSDKPKKHIYKLDDFAERDINRTKIVYFSTISKDVTFSLSRTPTEEPKNLIKFNYERKISETGINEVYFNEPIKDIYLIVKCTQKKYDVDYSFKYFSKNANNSIVPIKYKTEIITNTKISDFSTSLDLKISKIPNNTKTNYYIRIFEDKEESLGDLDITTSYRAIIPYEMYVVKYDNGILKDNNEYLKLNITTDIYSNYFIDAIAEIIFNEDNLVTDYYAYKKLYPSGHEEKNKKKDESEKSLVIISISVGAVLLIFIFILIIVVLRYREKNNILSDRVNQISFGEENQFYEEDK